MSINDFLERVCDLHICVVGDVMLDRYVWGDAERISSEAPVPVVKVKRDSYVAGGAANVALNVAGLGCRVSLVGALGVDAAGKELVGQLQAKGVECGQLERGGARSTVEKIRVMAQRQQVCRVDREGEFEDYGLSADALAALSALKPDAWIVSDYGKGVIDDALLAALKSDEEGAPVFVDPKPPRPRDFSGVSLLKPNRKEALMLAGLDPYGPFDAATVLTRLRERYAPQQMVVTLGIEGMILWDAASGTDHLPTQTREVFDVSGAGDTVISVLAPALATGCSLRQAAEFANQAAGIVVSHMGTYAIQAEDLLADA